MSSKCKSIKCFENVQIFLYPSSLALLISVYKGIEKMNETDVKNRKLYEMKMISCIYNQKCL